ncbi:DUF1592 domain-containing protein [Lignipirellula cremea]|nr:DUF1592 domain-containing protein [Lignipirellula cremea]
MVCWGSPLYADYPQTVRPLLQKYCFDCHGPKKQEGEMRLDGLDPVIGSFNQQERWVDVGDKLKQGDMPPAKAPQPTVEELATLITWVSENVRQSASRLAPPERFQVRRLTREQYNATLQDLLGLPLNFVKELPAEALSDEGFSNDAELLEISPLYIEYFLKNAEQAIDKAVVSEAQPSGGYNFQLLFAPLAKAIERGELSSAWTLYPDYQTRVGKPPKGEVWPPVSATYTGFPWKPNPKVKSPQELIEFSDGMLVAPRAKLHYGQIKSTWGRLSLAGEKYRNAFPTAGWLRVRITASSEIPEGAEPPSVQVMLNYDVLHGKTLNDLGTQKITAPQDRPETYDFLVRLENLNLPSQNNEKGPPYFEIWNPRWTSALDDSGVKNRGKGKLTPDTGPQSVAFIQSVEVNWPYFEQWPPNHNTQILGAANNEERSTAKAVLERFMRRAFRGPVDSRQVEEMLTLFDRDRAEGRSFLDSIRTSLATILCSPHFLYIDQSTSEEMLSQYAIASRLSYFLWNSMPDEQLFALARQAKLQEPDVLEAQTRRMLADPRSRRFVEQFASEWLDMPGLENVAVNREIFREFELGTEDRLKQETLSFFTEILDNDLSVLNFIDSDFLMMNNRLALHYGVPGVYDNVFHRVPAIEGRGGVLTHGSVLIATGTGEQSHPFRRGVWVLERLLGTPPPPPPPVVPELAGADPEFSTRPLKEQLEIHRRQASCAACHAKLDPWGLALENYDAIGLWRTQYKQGNKAQVVSVAMLPDGTGIESVAGLKRVILEEKRELFLKNFARKMLTYALARSLDATDETVVEELAGSLETNGGRMRQLVIDLVKHQAFQRL